MEQAAAQDPLLGAKVGNYVVQEKLGEGGMGAVYLAAHPRIGKKVALKVLHHEFSSNDEVVGRFFNEAKAVNDIQHPNIVDIIDYGTMPSPSGGQPVVYFIMEFLRGQSLASIIQEQAPLAPERAQAIAVQIADALGASHRHGIVHRDLKPDNVMISQRRDGRDFVKVLDFGIAKLTGDQHGSRRTRTGIVMGTPAYMSPEQCEGRGQIDHRTDIYALGILLYEMLAGQVPFRGEGYGEVLVQHMTQVPQKPSTIRGLIPPHLEAVCMKTLEKRADNRFENMDEVVKALADPVAHVESHGGLEGFLSYGYAGSISQVYPAQATPYPVQGPVPQPTPGMGHAAGQQTPGSGTPFAPSATPYPAAGAYPTGVSYATPAPVKAASSGLRIAIAAVVVAALGVGGFLGYKAMSGEDEPAPVVEPAAPGMVKVTIATRPSGADVFVSGEATPRGVTPLAIELPRGDRPVWVRLAAAGYEEIRDPIIPDVDRAIDRQLKALPASSAGTPDGSEAAGSKAGADGADAAESADKDATGEGSNSAKSTRTKTRTKTRTRSSGKRTGTSNGDNTLRPNL